jgi:hypothetical protein
MILFYFCMSLVEINVSLLWFALLTSLLLPLGVCAEIPKVANICYPEAVTS